MRQKNTDLVVYILWAVFGVILTGMLIYYIMNFVNGTAEATDHVIGASEEIASGYVDYDITKYDTEKVRGSEVVNFIKKNLGDYSATETSSIYVEVITKSMGTNYTNKYVNKDHLTDIKNFSSTRYYIIPTVMFLCEVIKTTNGAILGVKFTQQ